MGRRAARRRSKPGPRLRAADDRPRSRPLLGEDASAACATGILRRSRGTRRRGEAAHALLTRLGVVRRIRRGAIASVALALGVVGARRAGPRGPRGAASRRSAPRRPSLGVTPLGDGPQDVDAEDAPTSRSRRAAAHAPARNVADRRARLWRLLAAPSSRPRRRVPNVGSSCERATEPRRRNAACASGCVPGRARRGSSAGSRRAPARASTVRRAIAVQAEDEKIRRGVRSLVVAVRRLRKKAPQPSANFPLADSLARETPCMRHSNEQLVQFVFRFSAGSRARARAFSVPRARLPVVDVGEPSVEQLPVADLGEDDPVVAAFHALSMTRRSSMYDSACGDDGAPLPGRASAVGVAAVPPGLNGSEQSLIVSFSFPFGSQHVQVKPSASAGNSRPRAPSARPRRSRAGRLEFSPGSPFVRASPLKTTPSLRRRRAQARATSATAAAVSAAHSGGERRERGACLKSCFFRRSFFTACARSVPRLLLAHLQRRLGADACTAGSAAAARPDPWSRDARLVHRVPDHPWRARARGVLPWLAS